MKLKILNSERAINFIKNSWFHFEEWDDLVYLLKKACKEHNVNINNFYD